MEENRLMLHLDMLYRDILVVYGGEQQTRDTLRLYFDAEEIDDLVREISFSECGKTVYVKKFNSLLVWLPGRPKTAQEVGFLVHELFHATCAVMCDAGISLSEDSEEIFAYAIGFLAEKVMETLPTFSCPSQ